MPSQAGPCSPVPIMTITYGALKTLIDDEIDDAPTGTKLTRLLATAFFIFGDDICNTTIEGYADDIDTWTDAEELALGYRFQTILLNLLRWLFQVDAGESSVDVNAIKSFDLGGLKAELRDDAQIDSSGPAANYQKLLWTLRTIGYRGTEDDD